uniref:GAF domain-containing sensor histidine kinase n=1 Tax=Eiseniibacteriota bacterium TaxID=2212470 RepID=A0A832I4X4_UNCEI
MSLEPPDIREPLDDPFVRLSPRGEVEAANAPFRALALAHGVPPEPQRLFGSPLFSLIATVQREGRAHGVLSVVAPGPTRTFRVSATRDGAGAFGLLFVDISDEVAWRRQLFDRNRELTVLNDLVTALSGTLEPEVLARRIHDQTARIMHATSFYIAVHERDTGTIEFLYFVEDNVPRPMKPRPRPWGNGLTERLLRTGRPLLLENDAEGRVRALGLEPLGRPARSWIGAPLMAHGEPIGVIALQDHERDDTYAPHDLELLTIIAGQAAAAIHNARLYQAARRAYDELSRAQARLLESERLRGVTETVGALNHEVNNPLAAIAGNAQLLLRDEDALPPAVLRKVETILDAARRIQSVTARMASLIQATSMPYPGAASILDVRRSLSRDEAEAAAPGAAPTVPPGSPDA